MTENPEAEFDVLLSFAGSGHGYARAIHDIAIANFMAFLEDPSAEERRGLPPGQAP